MSSNRQITHVFAGDVRTRTRNDHRPRKIREALAADLGILPENIRLSHATNEVEVAMVRLRYGNYKGLTILTAEDVPGFWTEDIK